MRKLRESYDLLIVGGGINGVGIARDAAGRGLSVLLCEQHDLAAHTSSASTKLIHGGLRYLEHGQFALVRKSLQERERLLGLAPHVIWPMRFVVPHDAHLRPMWLIRIGLFVYDHLARRRHSTRSDTVDLHRHPAGGPLQERFREGFVYSDGWVDDARLVVLNAMDAAERGATILTHTRCDGLERDGSSWRATLRDLASDRVVRARAVVNATGPWVDRFLCEATTLGPRRAVRLVKGSHIIVRRLHDHRFAYLFQNPDKRVVFAIPYEDEFTLIGTTDVEYSGNPAEAHIDADEIDYLCRTVNRYFADGIAPNDVVHAYSGVRPLVDDERADPSAVTRDYSLDLDSRDPPLLTVHGGKITTYRRLAEQAVDRLTRLLGRHSHAWTAKAPLPGGDVLAGRFSVFLRSLEARYPWLPPALSRRYARAYGTRIHRLIGNAESLRDLGEEVLPQLYEREIDYLCRYEWARNAQDILWRRTKLGLHLPAASERRLNDWLTGRTQPTGAQAVNER